MDYGSLDKRILSTISSCENGRINLSGSASVYWRRTSSHGLPSSPPDNLYSEPARDNKVHNNVNFSSQKGITGNLEAVKSSYLNLL